MAIVDFTHPGARRWFADKLRRMAEMGIDSLKADFEERIATDVVYHDGSDPVAMHNFYPLLYNQRAFDLLEELNGRGEAVLFARSSYASGQRLPGEATANPLSPRWPKAARRAVPIALRFRFLE